MTLLPATALTGIADLALQEWRRRRAAAQRAVDGGMPRAQAEAMLRPWLALAVRTGVEDAALAGTGAPEIVEDYRRVPGLTPGEVRWLAADLIARAADQRAELARAQAVARAKALAAAEPLRSSRASRAQLEQSRELQRRSDALLTLAIHLGVTAAEESSEATGRDQRASSANARRPLRPEPSGAEAPRPASEGANQRIPA